MKFNCITSSSSPQTLLSSSAPRTSLCQKILDFCLAFFKSQSTISQTTGRSLDFHEVKDNSDSLSNNPFWEMDLLKHIPFQNKNQILSIIEHLHHRFTEEELSAFKTLDVDHSIFKNENWPYLAFQAYLEDRISQNAFVTLMQYNDALSANHSSVPVQTYDLLNPDNTPNEEARSILLESLAKKFQYQGIEDLQVFSEEIIDRFLKSLEQEDAPLKIFVTTPEDTGLFKNVAQNFPLYTLSNSLGQKSMLCMPLHLEQKLNSLQFENPIRIDPIIGENPRPPLSNPEKRIVSIGAPGLLPGKAHNLETTWASYTHHDAHYHILLECAIELHRKLWIDLWRVIKDDPTIGKEIKIAILDRELPLYLSLKDRLSTTRFWLSLASIFSSISFKYDSSFTPHDWKNADTALDLILSFIKENKEDLCKNYDISSVPQENLPRILEVSQFTREKFYAIHRKMIS